jgi:hypothetical protein
MNVSFSLGVLAAVLALNLCALGDLDEVLYLGLPYCMGLDDCRNFADWGATPAGYLVLYDADGHTISDYFWVNGNGFMTFESRLPNGGFGELPPANLPFLGGLIENGSLQQVNQFFPGAVQRPLFLESTADTTTPQPATPEPSTLLLFGPAAVFLYGRARRFWRART